MKRLVLSLLATLCLASAGLAQTSPALAIGFQKQSSDYAINVAFTPAFSNSYWFGYYSLGLRTTQANGYSYTSTVPLAPVTISLVTVYVPGSTGFATGDSVTVQLLWTTTFGSTSVVSSASATYQGYDTQPGVNQ